MKSLIVLICCLFFLTCQYQVEYPNDMQNLISTIDAFYSAVEAGDFYSRIDLFADSAIVMPNGGNIIRGKQVLKERWEPYKDAIFRIKDLERLEVKISGDMAYTVNSYYFTYHNQGEEAVWYKTKNIHLWQRQADGSWKLYLDIWNSSGS